MYRRGGLLFDSKIKQLRRNAPARVHGGPADAMPVTGGATAASKRRAGDRRSMPERKSPAVPHEPDGPMCPVPLV